MSRYTAPVAKKSSTSWDRLRPVKQDPLESMGFVSKGDERLLNRKAQESFYNKIVARYMQFLKNHGKDLDSALTSLSPKIEQRSAAASNANTSSQYVESRSSAVSQTQTIGNDSITSLMPDTNTSAPQDELSTILLALRKLREGLLGSSASAPSPVFSQRVHIFNIQIAIVAMHAPSYQPSLSYLLSTLHSREHPLSQSELTEMTTYSILDIALRRNDLIAAYTLKLESKVKSGYENRDVDAILRAVITQNWVAFWRIRRRVDGYVRALMNWHVETVRRTTLKAFGRAYMKTDATWLLQSATGSEMSWEELAEKEAVGWLQDGNTIIIRKPKVK